MFRLSKSSLMPVKQKSCCMLSRYNSEACLISLSPLNLVLDAHAVVKDNGLEWLSRPPCDSTHQTWHPMTSIYFVIRRSCSAMTMRSNRSLSADSYLDSMLSEFYLNGIKELFDERSIVYYVLEAFVLSNDNNFACVICASYQIAKVFERTSSDV